MHWSKVSDGRNQNATDLDGFVAKISALPDGQLWRHNQAGDLPGENEHIEQHSLNRIVYANKGKRGFTYTHKSPIGINAELIARANREGFTINLSANNLSQADQYKALGIGPVVVVVPESTEPVSYTPQGNKVVICPAQQREGVTCSTCKLCSIQNRAIVGFRAHGQSKKRVEAIVR